MTTTMFKEQAIDNALASPGQPKDQVSKLVCVLLHHLRPLHLMMDEFKDEEEKTRTTFN